MNDTIENFETCTYVDFDNIDSDDDEFDENTSSNVIDKKRKSGVFSCDDCDKSFDLKSSFTRHVRTVHKNDSKAHKKEDSKALKRKLEGNFITSSKKTKEETFSFDECEYKKKITEKSQRNLT